MKTAECPGPDGTRWQKGGADGHTMSLATRGREASLTGPSASEPAIGDHCMDVVTRPL